MKKCSLSLLMVLLFLGFHSKSNSQQTPQSFVQSTNYYLYLPEQYASDSTTKWPLLMFLHGSGESGADITKVKAHGPPELADKGESFPFIIISPQSDNPGDWDTGMLYRLLQKIKREYRVNDRKIYLTGLSMGGFGTWDLAMKYPGEFAAIAPVCGGGDTASAWKLRHTPVWCFHGAKDDVVPPINSERMVKATRQYNSAVKFTLYPEANHNSWDLTYNNDSLYTWLMAQTKFNFTDKPIATSLLKRYEGIYANGPDTVQVVATDHGLVANFGRKEIPLRSAGNDVFFLDPARPEEIRFQLIKDHATGFSVFADEKSFFKLIMPVKKP